MSRQVILESFNYGTNVPIEKIEEDLKSLESPDGYKVLTGVCVACEG